MIQKGDTDDEENNSNAADSQSKNSIINEAISGHADTDVRVQDDTSIGRNMYTPESQYAVSMQMDGDTSLLSGKPKSTRGRPKKKRKFCAEVTLPLYHLRAIWKHKTRGI